MGVRLKSQSELERMRAAGQIVARVLHELSHMCVPGHRTVDFESRAAELIEQGGAVSLFKDYPHYGTRGAYPASICVSVNEEVVHGIPGTRVVGEGDIVSFDVGVKHEGFCADAAVTVAVGRASPEAMRLIEVTRRTLAIAVETIRPGVLWSAVAGRMERYVREQGFSVVTEFVGHSIGAEMHEELKLPNFVSPELLRRDILLEPGMTLAVEPMVNMGTHRVDVLEDGWTVVTADRKPSAHFEHTVAVVDDGCEILTRLSGQDDQGG